jgi:hypothetical protein
MWFVPVSKAAPMTNSVRGEVVEGAKLSTEDIWMRP